MSGHIYTIQKNDYNIFYGMFIIPTSWGIFILFSLTALTTLTGFMKPWRGLRSRHIKTTAG
uniref:Uncharacterized protein n=1 Tax=uncultured marine virus TaxID=186617 RepID=A0A0F7L3Y5_9VIRU|nr:hypothetical protein [uncultured marine virus]